MLILFIVCCRPVGTGYVDLAIAEPSDNESNSRTWLGLRRTHYRHYRRETLVDRSLRFSTGQVTARSETGVARDFIGFFRNFEKLFGISNYKIYMTVHVPCVAAMIASRQQADLMH